MTANLNNFFEPLIFKYRVAKEIKIKTDRYLSSDFNLLELINPDENKISDLMVLLLSPNGSHGQGKIFLNEFINLLKSKDKMKNNFHIDNYDKINIIREKVTTSLGRDRRIDITIEFDDKFCIGIENKPWAGEQEEQLSDYKSELEKHFSDNFLLIYLDGFGRKPGTIENQEELENQKKFLSDSYNDLLKEWLLRCYKECESEKVRLFLKDFVNWIEKNFRDMEEENV